MNNNKELTEQQANGILEALDKALETGPWEQSTFLRLIGKNLRQIRDNFAQQLSQHYDQNKATPSAMGRQVTYGEGQQEVFISLYSSEGDNLQAWERILANLPRQSVSRPIYAEEKHVQSLIKSKENKINEAYVVIYVDKNNILPTAPDKTLQDKFGKPLLTLKDRSIILENIQLFVHFSGHYQYHKGRLQKNQSPTPGA